MSRLQMAIDQIAFTRQYTMRLLNATPTDDWTRPSPGGVSHIAWQVGHLAYAQYRLALWRIRGPRSEDEQLFTPEFLRYFGPDSVPAFDFTGELSVAVLRSTFDHVHQEVINLLPQLKEAELDDAIAHPHPYAKTKFTALIWCAQHELVHAGQIGLLRRQLGHAPLW